MTSTRGGGGGGRRVDLGGHLGKGRGGHDRGTKAERQPAKQAATREAGHQSLRLSPE
jgi:hypothetical protein